MHGGDDANASEPELAKKASEGGLGGSKASGHAAHIGKFVGAGPDVRAIQRALDLLGGDGGGKEMKEERKPKKAVQTRWKGHGMPAGTKSAS